MGHELFEGVEFTERLGRIACDFYGPQQTKLLIRWPPLSEFQIWIRVKYTNSIDHLLDSYTKLNAFADAFVLCHRFPITRKSTELVLCEFLKELKTQGVNLNKWVLDLNANKMALSQEERTRMIGLFVDYQMLGLSFADYVDDHPSKSQKDMVYLSQNYSYFV